VGPPRFGFSDTASRKRLNDFDSDSLRMSMMYSSCSALPSLVVG
jgi:hypothetical protein